MIWSTLGIMIVIIIAAWVTIRAVLKLTSRALLNMMLNLGEIKAQLMQNAVRISNLEVSLLEARKANAEIILQHHTQICEMIISLVQLMRRTGTTDQEGDLTNALSMTCPFISKEDPENVKCKNDSNSAGECDKRYCPFLS